MHIKSCHYKDMDGDRFWWRIKFMIAMSFMQFINCSLSNFGQPYQIKNKKSHSLKPCSPVIQTLPPPPFLLLQASQAAVLSLPTCLNLLLISWKDCYIQVNILWPFLPHRVNFSLLSSFSIAPYMHAVFEIETHPRAIRTGHLQLLLKWKISTECHPLGQYECCMQLLLGLCQLLQIK